MQSNPQLGELLPSWKEGKDAIHIAIVPVTADEELQPGQHVGFVDGNTYVGTHPEPVGIVDPFLKNPVKKGEKCWLCMYPYTITALRHEWKHPAFSEGPDKEISIDHISRFAHKISQSYESLMRAADECVDYGEWTMENTESYRDATSSEWRMFWHHYEIVTGKKVKDYDEVPYSCAC